MKKTIKYLQDGEYHYATVKDVGDLEQLKTKHKEDLVTALNELFTTGGNAKPTGYDDLVKKVNDTQTTVNGINNTIVDVNGKIAANDEAIAQAKKDLQDALTQFQTFNDEIEQAKKDAETKLANAKQALKDEFNANLADAQKANQKQLEDKIAVIQGNLDTTSNTLNDVKTQLANAKLDYGNVNVSIQKLNDMLSTKLSSTDLDPLRTSIQNQETEIQQTKDSIATKAGKAELNALSGRVSNTEAKIKQQADEISLGVKKSELNGAIDNYQIEGTNRLRDTIDFDIDGGYWKLDRYSINSNTDVHPYDQAHDVSALVLQKTGSAKQNVDFTNEDLGQSFVVSMWNKKDAQPQVWYGNTQLTNRQVAEIKGDYERSFFTFIPTNVNVKTIMFKSDAGTVDQLVIGEPKLELGTKPKAYAPNPNDEHKQIVNTKAELKIASDKIESTVKKQTKTDNNVNQLSSRVTQTEQGITAANDLITKTKDGLIKDYTGKINASAKSLSSEFDEKTNEKIGQITDSGENLILNSAFTNEADRKDKWQNISDKVNIVADDNSLMWAHLMQSGLTADNPISLTSNYFPIKQGKVTVGVDIKSDNTNGLSGAKILVLQTYNANKQRVDFTELSLENMGLTISQLADGQSHRGVYRLGNDRSDAVYMTVKAVLPRNGSIYFTNFSAKLSSIDNGGYTPNAEDLKRQILNQKTKIEQNSQQITLKASSTELRDVRTIANGAVSSATNANNNASSAMNTANTANSNANQANSKITDIQANGGGRNLLQGTGTATGDVANGGGTLVKGAFNGYDAVKTNGAFSERYINMKSALGRTNAKVDDWFTLSVYVKADKQINTGAISDYRILGTSATSNDGAFYSILMSDKPITTQWQQYSFSFQINDTSLQRQNTRIEYSLNTGDNWIYWAGWMLEKGTIAHEWQPAPEDIQSQIDQARTDIQSTLTVANNGITAATNLKTTYDNYVQKNDANIKLLGDRITNEVSKITSNGGGINLLTGSKTMHGVWSADGTSIFSADGYLAVRAIGNNMRIYQNPSEDTNGKLMSVSFDAEVLADSNNQNVQIWVGPFQAGVGVTISGNTFKRYKVENWKWNSVNKAFSIQFKNANDKINIKNIKLEFGAVATPWSPAPEDTDSAIEAVSSKIDQTATSITSTVNSTKQDLQGQISNVNTKITQTANSITEQLKSYSKTGDMQNYVNTTIQKTADGITSKVSGVETSLANANSKLDGITSNGGGRNLAIGTSDSWITAPDVDRWNITTIATYTNAQAGDVFTVSIDTQSTKALAWQIWQGSSEYERDKFLTGGDHWSIASGTTHSHTTFTWPSGATQYLIVQLIDNMPDASHASYQYKNVMLEKGTVAHDWSPAPEDTDAKITTNSTAIEQNKKAIALKADQTEVDQTNGNVQQLQSQLKVQADQISAKVSSSDLDAKGYATQAYTQSQIKQTADSINSTINNNQQNAESRFQQTDAKLSATVTKDQLQAGFNIADGKIDLMGKKLALTGDMIASGGPYQHNHVGYMGQRSGGWQSSENWQIDGERFNFTSDDIPIAGNRFVYSRFLIDEILGLKTYASNADERINGPYVTDRFLERKGNHVYDFINRKDVPDDAPENAGAIKITALGAGDISNNYIGLKYMFLDTSKHFVDTTKVLVPKDNALYMKRGGKKLYGEQYMIAGVNAEAGTEIKNWYYFDKNDRDGAAAMDKFVTLPDGRVVHYDSNGIMDHGEFMVGTDYYYADLADGEIRKNAIGLVQETHQLHYYGADGKRQTGNITIKNRQYTFDANTGALTLSKKGEFQIGDDYYCLIIPYLGYIATGWFMLDDGRYVYYDPTTGAMVHGKHKIDGHTYNFTGDGSVLDEDRVGNYTADKKGLDFASLTSTDAPYYDNDLIDASEQNKYVYTYGKNIDNQFDVDPNRLYWAFKNGSLSKAGMIPNQKYLMEFEWWMSGDAEYYGVFYPQLSESPWQFNNKDIDWPVKISKQNNSGVYKRIISDGRDFSKVSDVKATGIVMRLDNVIGKLNVRNFHIIPLDTGMENTDATISFYARSLNGNVKLHVQDATSDVVTLTNQWQRYQVHLKCKDNASTVKFYLENSGIFEISMPKYELGTLATPWVDNGVSANAQKRESSISPFDGIVSKWSDATGEDTTQVSLRPDTGLIATDINNQFIYAKPNKAQLLPNSLNLMSGLADRSMEYTSEGFTYTGRDGKNLIFSIPYLHSITDVDTPYGAIYDFVASQNNRVNLIRNSNFSNAQDGWNMGSGCSATIDDFVNGAPYLQISIDTNTDGYAWQETKWIPATGQTLMVSVKVRKDIAHHIDDANAGVLLDFGNGGSIFLNPNWDSVKFGRWTQLAWGPIPVPANANYFHPNLYLRNKGGKGWARICFSEFCVYPGIDVRPYSKG